MEWKVHPAKVGGKWGVISRRSLARRWSIIIAALVLPALTGQAISLSGVSPQTAEATEAEIAYRFVSIPDLFNADLGDVSKTRRWKPEDPNSLNRSYRRAIDIVFDNVAAEEPRFVAVAGDLVEGHWGRDVDNTGIFGSVNTRAQRMRAVTRAGNLYHGQWRSRFRNRNLPVYPAVGDHDIGDDDMSRSMNDRWPTNSFRYKAVPTFKAVWAKHMTSSKSGRPRFPNRPRGTQWAKTAYAVRPHKEMLWVTVDVFRYHDSGVEITVEGGQLRWLRRVLSRAATRGIDNVIVQGHVPVLGPVRSSGSGGLKIPRGRHSKFWQLLKNKNVDMYLCGEVHAVTAIDDGVVQICHGGMLAFGSLTYMLGTVYVDGRVELVVKRFQQTDRAKTARLWQTSAKRPPRWVSYRRDTEVVATGSYGPVTGFVGTGLFEPYDP